MLNPTQQRVFKFICGYISSNKQSPTLAEIGKQFSMTSSASVHAIIRKLESEGFIKRTPNVSRGIQIVGQG